MLYKMEFFFKDVEKTYFYLNGKRISLIRAYSAAVIPANFDTSKLRTWSPFKIENKRFQIIFFNENGEESDDIRANKDLEGLANLIIKRESNFKKEFFLELEDDSRGSGKPIPLLVRENNKNEILVPTSEIIAQFKKSLDKEIEEEILKRNGKIIRSIDYIPNSYLIKAIDGSDGLNLANSLVEDGLVNFAHPNFIEEIPLRLINISNELFSSQWHLKNEDTEFSEDILSVWNDITTGSPNTTICILDNGIDQTHEAFSGPGKIVSLYDFNDNDPIPEPNPYSLIPSHGTSCAGIVAAPLNLGKVVGVAPDCSLMIIRKSKTSESIKIADSIVWAAEHGADIINCSFGKDNRNGIIWEMPPEVKGAIDYVTDKGRKGKGCIIIFAAGNGNESISTDRWASYERVISVGAITKFNKKAYYSSWGNELDICAPGGDDTLGLTTTKIGGYTTGFYGTSAAAPVLSGIAALLISKNPELYWYEVHSLLFQSADKIDNDEANYDHYGHSKKYGFGKVNAYKALKILMTGTIENIRNPYKENIVISNNI